MKNLERMIAVTCVLMVVGLVVKFGTRSLGPWLVNAFGLEAGQAMIIVTLLANLSTLLLPLAIAVWMYVEARRDQAYPWVWFLLGLTYQYLAPVMYLAWKLYQRGPVARNEAVSA